MSRREGKLFFASVLHERGKNVNVVKKAVSVLVARGRKDKGKGIKDEGGDLGVVVEETDVDVARKRMKAEGHTKGKRQKDKG